MENGSNAAITKDSIIGVVVKQKGKEAEDLMNEAFCVKECCPNTNVTLGHAAKLCGKEEELPDLLKKLNALPDIVR
jgi:hypothetical protein